VQSASDGAETFALYQRAKTSGQPFSAVIVDLAIPQGIGGKKTVKMLQEIDPQVKVIVSSGSTRDPAMLDHEQYGFCDVLPKPYSPDDLWTVLQRVLHAEPTAF
jgi:DNA-binding NtrC family response regulator